MGRGKAGECRIPGGRGGRCGFAEVRAVREPPLLGRGIRGEGERPTPGRSAGRPYGNLVIQLSVGGGGLVGCGFVDGDGRRPVDDALVIRHRAIPPPLLRSSGDSGVPGRWDATGPLPLNARRTTDRSGPDVRVGSYGVGCTALRRPGPRVQL